MRFEVDPLSEDPHHVSIGVEFLHVKLRGGEGTLHLSHEKISFQSVIQTKKTLSWAWTAVRSHEAVNPSFKPTWSMTVTVRGTITEQLLFVLKDAKEVKRLQNEAYKRSALAGAAPPSLVGSGGAPKGPKKSSKLDELKRQMAAQQTNAQKEAEAYAKKNKAELGGLGGGAGVGDIRKQLGGKLPGQLRVPNQEAGANPPPGAAANVKKIDSNKKNWLESKLAIGGPPPKRQMGNEPPAKKIDTSKRSALEGKLAFKPPRPPPGQDGPSAFSKVPPTMEPGPKKMSTDIDTSKAVRPKPMFLAELSKTVPTDTKRDDIETSQTMRKSDPKPPPLGASGGLMAELQATLAAPKTKTPPRQRTVPTGDDAVPQFTSAQDDVVKSKQKLLQGQIPTIPTYREEPVKAKRDSEWMSKKNSAAVAAVAATSVAAGAATVAAVSASQGGSSSYNEQEASDSFGMLEIDPEEFDDEDLPPRSSTSDALVVVGLAQSQTSDANNNLSLAAPGANGALVPMMDEPVETFEDEVKEDNALVVYNKNEYAIVPAKKKPEDAAAVKVTRNREEDNSRTKLIGFLLCLIILVIVATVVAYFMLEDDKDGGGGAPKPTPSPAPTAVPEPTVHGGFIPITPEPSVRIPTRAPVLTPAPVPVVIVPGAPSATGTQTPTFADEITTPSPTSGPGTSVPTFRPSSFVQTSQPAFATTLAPSVTLGTQAPQFPTADLLVTFPPFTQTAFGNPDSPQSQARNWLLGDPDLISYPEWKQTQRFALAAFYYSFNGDAWPEMLRDSWMRYDNGTECSWWGSDATARYLSDGEEFISIVNFLNPSAVCNNEGFYVGLGVYDGTAIATPFHQDFVNSFVGTIPPEVSFLTSLESMSIQTEVTILGISMGDLIPTELLDLASLAELDLSNCFFREWDFTVISELPALTSLDLSYSDLNSPLPSELGLLSNLEKLDLSHSYRLTPALNVAVRQGGSSIIPAEISRLSNLDVLSLTGNRISGAFPPELSQLTSLESLLLSACNIETLPPTSLTSLQRLDMSFNSIKGPMSVELGMFTALQYLDLSNNRLSGALPSEVGLLAALDNLNLIGNDLSGSLPVEVSQATSLQVIDLARNRFCCNLPPKLLSLSNLLEVNLGYNNFSGSLPTEIGLASQLETLILNNNEFTGTLPTQIGDIATLETLDVPMNLLSGTVPWSALAQAFSLSFFDGSDNNLFGSIDGVSWVPSLQKLYLQGNDFQGTFPMEMIFLTSLSNLDLSQNRISGSIPREIGLLNENLSELLLDWNLLTNQLPTEIGLLAKLKSLSVRGYTLTGSIPAELGKLAALELLMLSGNPLTGTIPTTVGLLTAMTTMSLELTTISGTIPSQVGTMTSLTDLLLNATDLTGTVPPGICDLSALERLWVDCADIACGCSSCECG